MGRLLFAIFCAVIVGFGNSTTAFFNKLSNGHFSPIIILFALFAVPFFCLIIVEMIFQPKKLSTLFHSNCYFLHLIRAASNVIAWFCYTVSLQYASLPTALVLYFTFPLIVPLIEKIWHHVHLGWKTWLGILIGFIGMVVIVNPTEFSLGAILALVAGIMIAVDIALVNLIVEKDQGLKVVFHFFFFCFLLGVVVFCVGALSYENLYTFEERWLLVWVGLAYLITQYFVVLAQKHVPARIVAPIYYTAIIGAVLYQYFYFGEPVSIYAFIGMGLIIIGSVLVVVFGPVNVVNETKKMKPAKQWLKERK